MALPTYVSSGVASSGTGALTPAMPGSLATNDILVLCVNNTHTSTAAATLTTANGFVAVSGGNVNSGAGSAIRSHQTLFWRRYDGTGSAPTVADNGEFNVARIFAFRGCVTSGDPWDVVATDGDDDSNTTLTHAFAGSTTVADCLVAMFATAFTGGAGSLGSWANASLSNLTEVDDTSYNVSGDFVHLALLTGEKAAAGVLGTTTATWTGPAYALSSGIALALKGAAPASSGAFPPIGSPIIRKLS
jgi:hypothetical protein